MGTFNLRLNRDIKAGLVVLIGFGLVGLLAFAWEARIRVRERELAEEFRAIATEIVDKGMTPRQAIVYSRRSASVKVDVGISQVGRDANAFKDEDLPVEFDTADGISFGVRLPSSRLYGTNVYGAVDFENGRATRWEISGLGTIDYRAGKYSGRRE